MRISDWSSDVCSSDLFDLAGGHVDYLLHRLVEAVEGFEEASFAGQVLLDGLLDAGVQEFDMRGGVEKSVEVGRVVQHPHIALRRRFPFDEGKQRYRIGRSEERRVGKEGVSTCRSRGSQFH